MDKKAPEIKITKNGPYIVSGSVPLKEDTVVEAEDGGHLEYRTVKEYETQETYALCRCGGSKNKPYCDGTHVKIDFDGEEKASREPHLASRTSGGFRRPRI